MSGAASFGFFCSCGGAMTGAVQPASDIPDLEATFRIVHHGPGHEPTSREKAAYARRKAERVREARDTDRARGRG